jgi:RNA polymerase sigma factor (sigma-70 family)
MPDNSVKINTIENWVYQYGDALFSWAISKTKNKELSEDLVQDTFIAALKSFESFENRSQPKTWLISILNNKIIDYYRKEKTKSFLVSEKNGIVISDLMYTKNNFWIDNDIIPFWEQEKSYLRTNNLKQI